MHAVPTFHISIASLYDHWFVEVKLPLVLTHACKIQMTGGCKLEHQFQGTSYGAYLKSKTDHYIKFCLTLIRCN